MTTRKKKTTTTSGPKWDQVLKSAFGEDLQLPVGQETDDFGNLVPTYKLVTLKVAAVEALLVNEKDLSESEKLDRHLLALEIQGSKGCVDLEATQIGKILKCANLRFPTAFYGPIKMALDPPKK